MGCDLYGRSLVARLARRCGHGTRRGSTGNGAAPRLGDVVHQWLPLSRKSSADVLEPGRQLRNFRRRHLEHPFAADVGGDRAGFGHFLVGTICLWRGGRAVFRRGSGHVAGVVYLHALFDSRSSGGSMAHARLLLLSAIARRRASLALRLLGIRGDVCVECSDERPDRTGISGGSDRAFSVADGDLAQVAEAAPGLEHAGIPGDCHALARSGGAAESAARPSRAAFCGSTSSTSTSCGS